MTTVVVLQARTNSSRLPGKVLLSIGGMPLIVLASKRAANTGRSVLVVTSDEFSDDALAETLRQNSIEVFRGDLNNTLKRFVDALAGYGDATRVVRLTGDNIIPDGKLIDEMEEFFLDKGLRYLTSSDPMSGLPYGTSCEICYLGDLREVASLSEDSFDREHVTPGVIRKYGRQVFKKYQKLGMQQYRVTIDCLDDYISMQKVIQAAENPVSESFLDIIKQLPGAPYQPLYNVPSKKIILGAAQLGMDYGINNKVGKPSQEISIDIIKAAIVNGVSCIDTANAYGESEKVIGNALEQGWRGRVKVITKLSPLNDCPERASREVVKAFVHASVNGSRAAMKIEALDVLLLHRVEHLTAWGGGLWDCVLELKQKGLIGSLGASVQSPEELDLCLSNKKIEYIQMPFNVLDHRWSSSISKIRNVKSSRNLKIHTRSSLLQGLLPSTDTALWKKVGVKKPNDVINWLDALRNELGYDSVAKFCIAYCINQNWVDGVVIGVENLDQLYENLAIARLSDVDAGWGTMLQARPILEESVLNPGMWT
jgi:spore coat polysaccharide biosynthesis protein SpsF